MVEHVFIYIKKYANFLWVVIEKINGILIHILFDRKLLPLLDTYSKKYSNAEIQYRLLGKNEMFNLSKFLLSQNDGQLLFFRPHSFSYNDIINEWQSHSIKMLAVYKENVIIGYFFLRCFFNKKVILGKIIDKTNQGKGISTVMSKIMLQSSWEAGMKPYSIISDRNLKSLYPYMKLSLVTKKKRMYEDYFLYSYQEKIKSESNSLDKKILIN
jgi:hypothetical protein